MQIIDTHQNTFEYISAKSIRQTVFIISMHTKQSIIQHVINYSKRRKLHIKLIPVLVKKKKTFENKYVKWQRDIMPVEVC